MSGQERQVNRTKAILAGAISGMILSISAVLFLIGSAAHRSAYFSNHGLTPSTMVMIALPGTLMIGSIIAFPTSAAMVWFTTAISRKVRMFDQAAVWIASGIVFSSPTAYFFSTMQYGRDQFALISIWSFLLSVGGASGLAAWICRYTKSANETD